VISLECNHSSFTELIKSVVLYRLTLQENETEGPGSILSNGEDRMELIVIIKVHGRDPPMASNGRSASSISLSTMPMYLTELDSITINGSATTSTELVSVLAGSCDDVTSPKWIRDLVKCRRDHALGFHEDDNETWHSMVRGSVVPSIELIADELIVFIDVAERSPSVTNLLNCRYAYASLRTMDKRASEWEQAIKVGFLVLFWSVIRTQVSRFRRLSIQDHSLLFTIHPMPPSRLRYHYYT